VLRYEPSDSSRQAKISNSVPGIVAAREDFRRLVAAVQAALRPEDCRSYPCLLAEHGFDEPLLPAGLAERHASANPGLAPALYSRSAACPGRSRHPSHEDRT